MASIDELDWLPRPYEYWTPRLNEPKTIRVVRFDVGLTQRPIKDPPYAVIKPTLRLYVPEADKPGRAPWWDWTAAGFVQRFAKVYSDTLEGAMTLPFDQLLARMEALSQARPRPLTLQITRRVLDDETSYEIAAVED